MKPKTHQEKLNAALQKAGVFDSQPPSPPPPLSPMQAMLAQKSQELALGAQFPPLLPEATRRKLVDPWVPTLSNAPPPRNLAEEMVRQREDAARFSDTTAPVDRAVAQEAFKRRPDKFDPSAALLASEDFMTYGTPPPLAMQTPAQSPEARVAQRFAGDPMRADYAQSLADARSLADLRLATMDPYAFSAGALGQTGAEFTGLPSAWRAGQELAVGTEADRLGNPVVARQAYGAAASEGLNAALSLPGEGALAKIARPGKAVAREAEAVAATPKLRSAEAAEAPGEEAGEWVLPPKILALHEASEGEGRPGSALLGAPSASDIASERARALDWRAGVEGEGGTGLSDQRARAQGWLDNLTPPPLPSRSVPAALSGGAVGAALGGGYGASGDISGDGKRDLGDIALGAGIGGLSGALAGHAVQSGYRIDPNRAGMFFGSLAKTADLGALAKAQEMEAGGIGREAIWNETGWFKGVDGKWRHEIDDSGARFVGKLPQDASGYASKEAFDHPTLYEAYPHTAETSIIAQKSPYAFGSYSPNLGAVEVYAPSAKAARDVALHEKQHQVQSVEGFAAGGSPGDFASHETPEQAYDRLAGEVEARAVQKRMDLTPAERRGRPPWLDYDVPENDQIVRFKTGGAQMSMPPIIAYHGSPHDFERFDIRKMGSGEGAQAYGPGLYYAQSEPIARHYRDALSKEVMTVGGRDIETLPPLERRAARLADMYTWPDPALATMTPEDAADFVQRREKAFQDDVQYIMSGLDPKEQKQFRTALDKFSGKVERTSSGKLYQVGINADPNSLLNYDADPNAHAAIVNHVASRREMTNPAKARAFDDRFRAKMLDAGVPGIQYNDASSRVDPLELATAREDLARAQKLGDEASIAKRQARVDALEHKIANPSKNYVIFDDKLVNILRKYGVPLAPAGLGAAAALSPDEARADDGSAPASPIDPDKALGIGLLAAGGALGAAALRGRELNSMTPAAEFATMARKSETYLPPAKPPRSFFDDYPRLDPSALRPERAAGADSAMVDDQGRMLRDLEGRPLIAERVAGRRTRMGADTAIPEAELNALATRITGSVPKSAPRRVLGGADGVFLVSADGKQISFADDLDQASQDGVIAHEIAHAIDYFGRNLSDNGIKKELAFLYSVGATGKEPAAARDFVTPQAFGYRTPDKIRAEQAAEAIRLYMQDPNYVKTVAPKTAKAIRALVNPTWPLNTKIQFNQAPIALLPPAGVGLAAMSGQDARADDGKGGDEGGVDPDKAIGLSLLAAGGALGATALARSTPALPRDVFAAKRGAAAKIAAVRGETPITYAPGPPPVLRDAPIAEAPIAQGKRPRPPKLAYLAQSGDGPTDPVDILKGGIIPGALGGAALAAGPALFAGAQSEAKLDAMKSEAQDELDRLEEEKARALGVPGQAARLAEMERQTQELRALLAALGKPKSPFADLPTSSIGKANPAGNPYLDPPPVMGVGVR